MLLFKTLALAMSIPIPKLVVIEEPEYVLAPLQQIVLSEIYWNSWRRIVARKRICTSISTYAMFRNPGVKPVNMLRLET